MYLVIVYTIDHHDEWVVAAGGASGNIFSERWQSVNDWWSNVWWWRAEWVENWH